MNSAIVYASNCILGIIMVLFCMLTLKMRWGRAVTFIGAYAVVLFSFFGLLLLPDQNIAAKQTVGFFADDNTFDGITEAEQGEDCEYYLHNGEQHL